MFLSFQECLFEHTGEFFNLPRQSDWPVFVAVVFGDVQAVQDVDVSSAALKVLVIQMSQFAPFLL